MKEIRKQRVESQLRKEISLIIIEDIKDPRIKFVSVTHASLSNDLRIANVYVRVMGNDEERNNAMQGLVSASGFIRKEIGERMRLRYTPEIKFFFDESLDIQLRIENILREIKGTNK